MTRLKIIASAAGLLCYASFVSAQEVADGFAPEIATGISAKNSINET